MPCFHPTVPVSALRCALVGALVVTATAAHAVLGVYYDPGTGNVAFDTANTPTGKLTTYQFRRNAGGFREENHVRISDVVGYSSEDHWISDRARAGETLEGYYTIGDVFPSGLTEDTWHAAFLDGIDTYHSDIVSPGGFIGGEFNYIFGQPDRPYDNHWDWIDPSTLDWADSARLIYRQGTGELVLDTAGPGGGYISAFYVESDGAFLSEHFVSPVDTPLTITDPSNLVVYPGFPVEPGRYELGRVLPAGLRYHEFTGLFTAARFMGLAGVEGGNLDFDLHGQDLAVAYERAPVPEPAAGLVLSAFGLTLRRRRMTTLADGQ